MTNYSTRKNRLAKPGIFALITCLGLSLACSKTAEDDVYTNDPTVALIISHNWKIKDIKVPSVNMPNTDSIISKQCHTTGAVIKFGLSGTDGVFSFADSTAGSCDSTIFPYDYGYWGLRLAKDSLVFKGKKTEYRSMRLVSISKDSLLVNYADSASVPHIVKTITFIKQ